MNIPQSCVETFPRAPSLNQNRLARIPRRQAHTRFRPPGGHHTPPDATRPQNHHCTVTPGGGHVPPGATRLQNHHCTVTAWQGTRTAKRHAPAKSSLHHHRLVDFVPPPGATRRHRLAHPSHAARHQSPSSPSAIPFCLAEPSLPPCTTRQQWPLPLICVPFT